MTTQTVPYLYFDGTCREAMEFYHACLGGELAMQSVRETPAAAQFPAEAGDMIMHAELKKEGVVLLMASDMLRGSLQTGNQIELMLSCSSEEELRTFYDTLSRGGQANQPVRKEFWGAVFGQLTDRYGIQWMLNYGQG